MRTQKILGIRFGFVWILVCSKTQTRYPFFRSNVTKPTPNFKLELEMYLKEPTLIYIINKWYQSHLYQFHLNTYVFFPIISFFF